MQAPPYAILAKPAIKRMTDLKGKVISIGGVKDITRIYLERMLAPSGVKPGDYDTVYAGATAARFSALHGGAVDAAILLPPFNFYAESSGFNNLGLTIDAWFYDPANRAEAIKIMVEASRLSEEDITKTYDFIHGRDFFEGTGKVSMAKMNAMLAALKELGDIEGSVTLDRFVLPGVTQLTD